MAERYLALRADTNEMRPRIKLGETVIYDTEAEAEPGDDVVIDLANGGFIVRELIGADHKGCYRLKCYSPASVTALPMEKVIRMNPVIARCNSAFYDEITGRAQAVT